MINNKSLKIFILVTLFFLSVIVANLLDKIIVNKYFNSKYEKITVKIDQLKYLNLRFIENVLPESKLIYTKIFKADKKTNIPKNEFISREFFLERNYLESMLLNELHSKFSYENFVKDEAINKLSIDKKNYNYYVTQFNKGGITNIEIIVKNNNIKYLDLKNFIERQIIVFQDIMINHYRSTIKENINIIKEHCRIEVNKEISFIEKILINSQNNNPKILQNIFNIYLNKKSNYKFDLDYLEYLSYLKELKKNDLCDLNNKNIFNSEFLYLHNDLEKQKQYLKLLEDKSKFLMLYNPIKYEIIENSLKFEEIIKKRNTIMFTILFAILFLISNYFFLKLFKNK